MFAASIPIIQAPMLGASCAKMTLEACRAGAIGSFAAAGIAPEKLAAEISDTRQSVGDRPFIVNLFVLEPVDPAPEIVARAMAEIAPYRAELGLPAQSVPQRWAEDFSRQFEALVAAAPPAASFTFGLLSPEQARALKARGIALIGTATSVAEALAWREIGADAICAQGMEAGGHRGTFLGRVEDSLIGVSSLVPAILRAVDLPVIAAGGIMDGRGIAAMRLLGADYVQMGTAFLLSEESAISAPWKAALKAAKPDSTKLTRAFSGRFARGIENRFMREMEGRDVPPYPIQNALTQDLRKACAAAGRDDMLSLWAGQGVDAIRSGKTYDLIHAFWSEAQQTEHFQAKWIPARVKTRRAAQAKMR
jgi:nitronate monooxygenase